MDHEYVDIRTIYKKELAGCLPEMNDFGNFDTLRERLYMMVGLYRKMAIADKIQEQILKEANRTIIVYHEYIINELQFECRLAQSWDKPDELKEQMINQEWAAKLLTRFPPDIVAKAMNQIKKRRTKRLRIV